MCRENYSWRIIICFGFVLFLVNSIIFIIFGEVNTDEGWYLYASKLVYLGKQPYRDFAYTQTPLLPYIYGFAQSFLPPSLYLGRITTVILSIVGFFLSISFARRKSGEMASGIVALLWATFTFGIYYQSITRTYSLITLFFLLTLFTYSLKIRKELKLILTTFIVLLAALTRLSALFFAIPFIYIALIKSNKQTRLVVLAIILLATTRVLLLSLPNVDSAIWSLVGHHMSHWGVALNSELVTKSIVERLLLLIKDFPQYILLFSTLLIIGNREIPAYLKRNISILLTVIGLSFFALPHFVSSGFHTNYFVPFVFVMFP